MVGENEPIPSEGGLSEGKRGSDSRSPSRLPLPPTADEIVELALRLAAEAPEALPALIWSICRSSRATQLFRTWRPSGAHLAMLQGDPAGARLIASSRAGAEWLRKWTETGAVLDDLLPLMPPAAQDEVDDESSHE